VRHETQSRAERGAGANKQFPSRAHLYHRWRHSSLRNAPGSASNAGSLTPAFNDLVSPPCWILPHFHPHLRRRRHVASNENTGLSASVSNLQVKLFAPKVRHDFQTLASFPMKGHFLSQKRQHRLPFFSLKLWLLKQRQPCKFLVVEPWWQNSIIGVDFVEPSGHLPAGNGLGACHQMVNDLPCESVLPSNVGNCPQW
jgi:hypothetical protein